MLGFLRENLLQVSREDDLSVVLITKLIKSKQIVQDGASFAKMLDDEKNDILLSVANPEEVAHIRQVYESCGPLSSSKKFERTLEAVNHTMQVSIEAFEAPNTMCISLQNSG